MKTIPFDSTGQASQNRIVEEPHVLVQYKEKPYRLIFVHHGPLFVDDVSIKTQAGDPVSPDVIKGVGFLPDAAVTLGKSVVEGLVITDPSVPAEVLVTYQAMGGPRKPSSKTVIDVLTAIEENDTFEFSEIAGKPNTYTPTNHPHKLWHLYGMESWIALLTRLENAIRLGEQGSLDELQQFIQYRLDECQADLDTLKQELLDHLRDFNNPHLTNKVKIGLGNVVNVPIASLQELVDRTTVKRYITPRLTDRFLASDVAALNDHRTDLNNPHGTVADDVDAYTNAVVDSKLASRLDKTATAADTARIEGRDYTTFRTAARQNLPGGLVTQGRLAPQRLGSGTASSATVLMGDGTYRDAETLIKEYIQEGSKVTMIDFYGNPSQAVSHISSSFSDINQYPVGSIVLYRDNFRHSTSYGNGSIIRDVRSLRMVIRRAGGWTDL